MVTVNDVNPGEYVCFIHGHPRKVSGKKYVEHNGKCTVLLWLDGSTSPTVFFPDSIVLHVWSGETVPNIPPQQNR